MPPIVGSSVTQASIWGLLLCPFEQKQKNLESFAIRAENNVHFLSGMEMISPRIFGLWMTGHNVARWDNSSLNPADQREWANSWSYVEPVEDILIFWPFKEIRKIWTLGGSRVDFFKSAMRLIELKTSAQVGWDIIM